MRLSLVTTVAVLSLLSAPLQAQPPPQPSAAIVQNDNWVGNVRAGLTYNSGNTDNNLLDLGTRVGREKKSEIWTFEGGYRFGESDNETNVDASKVVADYKHLLSERFYVGAGAKWARDQISDIKYRATFGPRIGYFLLKDSEFRLSVEGGPSYVFEEAGGVDDHYLSPELGERFEWNISKTAKLFQEGRMNFDVSDGNNWVLGASAGLETTVTETLSLIFSVNYDYDNLPALDRSKGDLTLITSLAFNIS